MFAPALKLRRKRSSLFLIEPMKKQILKLFFLCVMLVAFQHSYSQITFTVSSSTGSYSVSCANPTLVLVASSNYTGGAVSYTWIGSSFSLPVFNNSITVAAGTYTVIAGTGTLVSQIQTLTITGDSYPPSVYVVKDTTVLTCKGSSIELVGYSNTPNAVFQWVGPLTTPVGPSLTVLTPGAYTLNVSVLSSGCPVATTVITIGDNRIYPIVTTSMIYTVSCPNGTVALTAMVTGNSSVMSYSWNVPQGVTVSGINTSTLVTNGPGVYQVLVTNTVTGCKTAVNVQVWNCVGIADNSGFPEISIFPNPVKGQVYFKSEQLSVEQLNLEIKTYLGLTVYSLKNADVTNGIDLGFLDAGVYYLTLHWDQSQTTFKLVKE